MSSYPPQPPGGYPPPNPPNYGPPPAGQPGSGYPGAPPPYPGGAIPPYQPYQAPLPGQPGYQWGAGTPAYNFAGFGQRLVSVIVDGLIILALMAIPTIIGIFLIANGVSTNVENGTSEVTNGTSVGFAVLFFIIAFIIGVLYEPLLTARKGPKNGQTPGRSVAGIRITNLQGGPIGAGQAWGRYLFKAFFSGSVFYLGYLWMLWDTNKQGWHDKIANTLVLKA
jgi:uncharacterized RDD family membrane protein YckC